jgi:predicted nucleic acid-binding protein
MKRFAVDTSALMLFFEGGPGAEEVENLLWKATEKQEPILMPVVAWGELFRAILTAHGEKTANEKLNQMEQLPLQLIEIDAVTARQAAVLSAANSLDYLEALSVAAAIHRKATLVTANTKLVNIKEAKVLSVGRASTTAKA